MGQVAVRDFRILHFPIWFTHYPNNFLFGLSGGYKYERNVYGEGSCFYRSLYVRILELIKENKYYNYNDEEPKVNPIANLDAFLIRLSDLGAPVPDNIITKLGVLYYSKKWDLKTFLNDNKDVDAQLIACLRRITYKMCTHAYYDFKIQQLIGFTLRDIRNWGTTKCDFVNKIFTPLPFSTYYRNLFMQFMRFGNDAWVSDALQDAAEVEIYGYTIFELLEYEFKHINDVERSIMGINEWIASQTLINMLMLALGLCLDICIVEGNSVHSIRSPFIPSEYNCLFNLAYAATPEECFGVDTADIHLINYSSIHYCILYPYPFRNNFSSR